MKKIIKLGMVFFLLSQIQCGAISSAISSLISDCGGLSFSQVQQLDSLSEACKTALEDYLPSASNNYSSKIVALGETIDSTTHEPILYLQGANSSGSAYSASDFTNATITVTQSGTETTLDPSEYSIESLDDLSEDSLSIDVVTDYSGSMSDTDLDNVTLIYTDLFNVLPSVYEAAFNAFSDSVTLIQDFTSDGTSVTNAIARQDSISRGSTALYDGMGEALTSLVARTRPVKILIVSTDGMENSSSTYSKDQIKTTISDENIFVVMIGSLLSDVDVLKELAGSRGIYFYAQTYVTARSAVGGFVNSLDDMVKITINSAYQNASAINVSLDGHSVDVSF